MCALSTLSALSSIRVDDISVGLGLVHLAPVGGKWRVRHFLQLYCLEMSGKSL